MTYAVLLQRRRDRSCTGKVPYATRGEAKKRMRAFASEITHGHLGTLHVYRCEFCKRFHVGHRSNFITPPPDSN